MSYKFKITLVIAALLAALPFSATAQSSQGNIVGDAIKGEFISINSIDTGFKRELKIDKDGKFQVRRVPAGDYQVYRTKSDGTPGPVRSISVRAGSTARVMNSDKEEAKDISPGA